MGAAGGGAFGAASEAGAGAGVAADGTAIPRILDRILDRRSAFTLAAISSSVSPMVARSKWAMPQFMETTGASYPTIATFGQNQCKSQR